MKPQPLLGKMLSFCTAILLIMLFISCEKEELISEKQENSSHPLQRIAIGYDELWANAQVDITIIPRSHGYVARAIGRGTIPAGEYAGLDFTVRIDAVYSAIGLETLTEGEARVNIEGERFESVMDPFLQSFCCGEGHLVLLEGEYIFSVFGQVLHSTAEEPHNHLFAGLGNTAGLMNMNIVDQTGSVVEQADPPHDPGIGLIEDIEAHPVRVREH